MRRPIVILRQALERIANNEFSFDFLANQGEVCSASSLPATTFDDVPSDRRWYAEYLGCQNNVVQPRSRGWYYPCVIPEFPDQVSLCLTIETILFPSLFLVESRQYHPTGRTQCMAYELPYGVVKSIRTSNCFHAACGPHGFTLFVRIVSQPKRNYRNIPCVVLY